MGGWKAVWGGFVIATEGGLLRHCDVYLLCTADVACALGAVGLGDIGKHFSDTDAQYKGISSLVLLEKTYEMMDDRGYEISNLDAIILIEKPKMAPHIQKMKENISRILKCDIADVNIKATRGEKLGFVGHEEGAVSQCVVMLKKKGI